ncbi:MAG: hypothetical protein HQK77_18165, partial [Desulfobacterales bacterium]|nr:hypothetical protein [Desulfobacterales bacterium]
MGNFTPSIFIGIGGAGKNILFRIRRMIVENFKSLDNLPSIRFLHVDTDINTSPDGDSSIPMEVMGSKIQFNDAERCNISQRIIDEMNQGIDHIKQHPTIKEWFDPRLAIDNNFRAGAGGIRPYGKLAFHYAVNVFRQRLSNAVSIVKNSKNLQLTSETLKMTPDNANLNLYIVCSLLGGTGSGTFLEVCYNSLIAGGEGGRSRTNRIGMFIISGNVDSQRKANCYSALMELEYHSTMAIKETQHFFAEYPIPDILPIAEASPPLDICYVISHQGDGGYTLERDEMEESVALNLFMEFGSPISQEKTSRRIDITSLQAFRTLDDELNRSRQFLSFGFSTLEFPAPRIQDMFANDLASFVLKSWLYENIKNRSDIDIEAKEIENRLREEQLIKKELMTFEKETLLQKINKKLTEQELDIKKLIDAPRVEIDLVSSKVRDYIKENENSIYFSYDPTKCGYYIKDYIMKRSRDIHGLLTDMIQNTVHNLIENEYQGYTGALSYLDRVLNIIKTREESYKRSIETYTQRSKKNYDELYKDGLYRFLDNLGKEKFAMNHHNKKLHQEYIAAFMLQSLYREIYRTALQILTVDVSEEGKVILSIKSLIEFLQKQIGEYKHTLQTLSQRIKTKKEDIEKTILNTPIAEGIRLTRERLVEIKKEIIPNEDMYISKLKDEIIHVFSEKDPEGKIKSKARLLDLIIKRSDELESVIIQQCSESCEGIKKRSVATELKNKPNLMQILPNKINLSKPMIQVVGLKAGEGHVLRWLATTEPAGDMKHLSDTINTIYQYKGGDMKDRQLETLTDPYRVIFASEIGIFPLRRVRILNDYRREYRMIKPKHTHCRITYLDIFPSFEEDKIKQQTEYIAFFGKFYEFIVEKKDPETGYSVIYLTYFDDANRSTVYQKICASWKEVEDIVTKEHIEKILDRKITRTTVFEKIDSLIDARAKKLKTKEERENEWTGLQRYLESLKNQLESGELNPEFQRQSAMIQQYRSKYGFAPPEGKIEIQAVPQAAQPKSQKNDMSKPVQSPPKKDKETQFRDVLLSHFNRNIKDKDKLVTYGVKLLKLSKEDAER